MKSKKYLEKKFDSVKKIKIILVIVTILFLIGLVICVLLQKEAKYFIIGFLIVFISICMIYKLKLNNVVRDYKTKYINIALKNMFDKFNYKPDGNLDDNILKLLCWEPYNCLDIKRIVKVKDNLSGIYKGEKFSQNSLCVETHEIKKDIIGNGKHVETETLFDGIITEFKLKKNFNNILIYTKDISIAEFSEKIKTEDEKFNKKFNISSESKQDAFLFLTPNMMEKLNYLINEIISSDSFFLISNNKLYIGQNYVSNMFEPDLTKKIDECIIIDNIKRIMIYVEQIIDILELGDK